MPDILDKLINLKDYMTSLSDELEAHKVIMAHLYSCVEELGLSRTEAANSLKDQCQAAGIQWHLDRFAEGMIASVEYIDQLIGAVTH